MYQWLLAGAGVLAANELIRNSMLYEDTDIQKPADSVSIVMCTLDEEKYIEQSIQSILNQSIIKEFPYYFELIVIDGNSKDRTVEIAKKYVKDVYVQIGKGKLTARNLGVQYSRNNIIVSVDADRVYQQNWLNSLLKPYNEVNVVGVNGSSIWYHEGLHWFIQPLGYYMLSILYPTRLDGGNSSFRKNIYYQVNGFDETINQQEFISVVMEEEVGFAERLSQYGKIIYQVSATDYHLGSNKLGCRSNELSSEECEILGIKKDRM